MATDSRLSGPSGTLLDEGSKLFALPIICRRPGEDGSFSVPYYANTFALACVGSSLVYNNVYAFAVPLLSNLVGGPDTAPPSLEEMSDFLADVVTRYVRSLGAHRPDGAESVDMILGGFCIRHGRFEAHSLKLGRDDEGLVRFFPDALDLANGRAHFFGNDVAGAQQSLARIRGQASVPISAERAPIEVIKQFIASKDHPAIGGDLQLGHTVGVSFNRMATLRPSSEHGSSYRMNNIDIWEIGNIGPCAIGIMGHAVP